jgi:hypothetical protein
LMHSTLYAQHAMEQRIVAAAVRRGCRVQLVGAVDALRREKRRLDADERQRAAEAREEEAADVAAAIVPTSSSRGRRVRPRQLSPDM